MSTNITEAQVVAFLRDRALEVKQKFGADKYAMAAVDVSLYGSGIDSPVTTRVSIGSGAMTIHLFGSTFAEVWADAGDKTPESRAKKMREEAERLLAGADQLAPISATK